MPRSPLGLGRLLLLLGVLVGAAAAAASTRTITYKLQHSFGLAQPFTDRGAVEVQIDETGALRARAASGDDDGGGGGLALSAAEVAAVSESLSSSSAEQQGWYRLRAVGADGDKAAAASSAVMTSVPMCDVVRAGFRENITLTLDGQTGHLISLEYTPRMSRLSPKSCQGLKPLEAGGGEGPRFATAISVAVDQLAQSIPLVAPAVARPPGIAIRFDEAGGDRPPQPEKSFLQKYWIFIVLAFLLLNTGGAGPEEEEGQRAPGRPQAGGGGARPPPPQQGGGGARQRRT